MLKNDGKEKIMLKVSSIDRTAWFTGLLRTHKFKTSHKMLYKSFLLQKKKIFVKCLRAKTISIFNLIEDI